MITDTFQMHTEKTALSRLDLTNFDNLPFGKVFSDHMLSADYTEGHWQNVCIEPYRALRLSPANSALHYGQSVFEGLKAYKTETDETLVFRPRDNWERLNRSAERMCMPQIPEEIFMNGLDELLRLDSAWIPTLPGYSLYIRPFMFAADEYIGIRTSSTYRFMIITLPVGRYYAEPIRVKIEEEYSRSFEGGTGFAKSAGNYAGSLYPAKQAQDRGYHQLIWTDARDHKYIEESGTMNVMFVINGKIITPALSDRILAGITRDSVIKLAKNMGLEVEERRVSVEEILQAHEDNTLQEVFGTGTAATLAPIKTIGFRGVDYDIPVPGAEGISGKLLKRLADIRTGKAEDIFDWNYIIS